MFKGKHTQQITLRITGMHCEMCAANLKKGLESISGIKSVQASFAEQKAVVSFDDRKIDIPQMISAVKEIGYEASLLET